MMKSLMSFIVVILFLAAAPASSQTQWFKYEGNPVLDVGPSGTWDRQHVGINRVIRFQDTLKMWYSGSDNTYFRMGYATSTDDGITWTKHPNPVLDKDPGSWESYWVYVAYVVHSDSTYRMWYTGYNQSNWCVGYAHSPDGIAWTKRADPVVAIGPATWDAIGVEYPSIVGPDSLGGFRMWYQGVPSTNRAQIGYATATNETTWTKVDYINPVLLLGNSGAWEDNRVETPRVLYNGRFYEMWYGGTRTNNAFFSQIGYATSPDGLVWTKSLDNPVVQPGPTGTWDRSGVLPGDILLEGNIYSMWYDGYDGSRLRSGYAVSPKGMVVSVSPQSPSTGDTVWVVARADSPAGLSFSAEIEYPDGNVIALIELFDDGVHG
ncbi:MAG: hypothetical protein ACRDGA_08350, partial [Bacteroidota bacterium]